MSKKNNKSGRPLSASAGVVDEKPGIIRLKNSKPKYQITDINGKLSSHKNITLEVGWNVQPWVGALTWTLEDGRTWGRWNGIRGGKTKPFDMPAVKGKSASQEPISGSRRKENPAEASAVI